MSSHPIVAGTGHRRAQHRAARKLPGSTSSSHTRPPHSRHGSTSGRAPTTAVASHDQPQAAHQCGCTWRGSEQEVVNRLKQFRDLATHYAKRAAYYRGEILIAATILWLCKDSQDTA